MHVFCKGKVAHPNIWGILLAPLKSGFHGIRAEWEDQKASQANRFSPGSSWMGETLFLFDQPEAKDKKGRMRSHPLIRDMHVINCWFERIKQMMLVKNRCVGIAKDLHFGLVGATISQSARQPLVGDIVSQECPCWITRCCDKIRYPVVPLQQVLTLTDIFLEGDSHEPIGERSLTPGRIQIRLKRV